MRNFWIFIGKCYLFFKKLFSKKNITILLIIVIFLQFTFTFFLLKRFSTLQESFTAYKSSTTDTLNRTYSQVWLLNEKLNEFLNN